MKLERSVLYPEKMPTYTRFYDDMSQVYKSRRSKLRLIFVHGGRGLIIASLIILVSTLVVITTKSVYSSTEDDSIMIEKKGKPPVEKWNDYQPLIPVRTTAKNQEYSFTTVSWNTAEPLSTSGESISKIDLGEISNNFQTTEEKIQTDETYEPTETALSLSQNYTFSEIPVEESSQFALETEALQTNMIEKNSGEIPSSSFLPESVSSPTGSSNFRYVVETAIPEDDIASRGATRDLLDGIIFSTAQLPKSKDQHLVTQNANEVTDEFWSKFDSAKYEYASAVTIHSACNIPVLITVLTHLLW